MTYKTGIRLFILAAVFMIVLSPLSAWAAAIHDIRIEGAQRVEPATVLSYIDLKVGDEMSSDNLDRALKSLFATGLFADVNLKADGATLVVRVTENPIINEIAFEGNDRIKKDELLAEVQLKPREVFSRTKVQADVARLYQLYRRNGRFSVSIEPKIIKLDQNRVNLVFEIQEGEVTTVESIRFVGNKHFDDAHLRSQISTKETAWYRFITSDDRYDPDRLSYDQELLRKFYLSKGYADFSLVSATAELSEDKKHFYITFTIDEGERYKVGKIGISSGIRDFNANVLNDKVQLKAGDWYDAGKVQKTVDKLTDALGDLQYAFVNVHPDINRNRDQRTVDISFQISETPKVYVERININGNVRTLDKVIRRQMLLSEGDPFNKSKLARSEQKIKDLDFFETVKVETQQGSAPDKVVINVNVAEKSTGELSVGAGFSSSDGPLVDLGIQERNFLGKGQNLSLSGTVAGKRTEFDGAFTEPHFLDRDLSAGVNAFHLTTNQQTESSFDQKRTGGGFTLGYPLSDRWNQTLRYRAETNDITNVASDASRFIRDQEGTLTTSAFGQRLTYDSRDSKLFPTAGWLYWVDAEVAGAGGDAKYFSGKTGAQFYYPIADEWVFDTLGEVGAISGYSGKNVVISERYFLGAQTLRGFQKAGIGARDSSTGDALGGNYYYRGSAEVSFPLGLPAEYGIQGHAFSDIGSLWHIDDTGPGIEDSSSLRVSAGIGASWRSPFGPLRIDLAKPIVKQSYDKQEILLFDFGTRF